MAKASKGEVGQMSKTYSKALIELLFDTLDSLAQRTENLQRQLDFVDEALPPWVGTGRGRVDTINQLMDNPCRICGEKPRNESS